MNQFDPYLVLGVTRTASTDEIKQAYHYLVRQYHPDLHPCDPAATATIQAINAAADMLCDPLRRARFDQSILSTDSGEMGKRCHQGNPYQTYGRRDGHPVTCTTTITPEEARMGTQRALLFHAPDGAPYHVHVTIPPGATSKTRLRVPEQGGPGLNGGCRGDLYVQIIVVPCPTPAYTSAQQVAVEATSTRSIFTRLWHWLRKQ